jgi:hypothetical protein
MGEDAAQEILESKQVLTSFSGYPTIHERNSRDTACVWMLLQQSSGEAMKWMYDIYQKLPGGGRLWIESAMTLATAEERLSSLCQGKPALYLIYHFSSGKLVEPVA